MGRTSRYYHMRSEELDILRDLAQDLEDAGLIPPAWVKKLEKSRTLRPSAKKGRPKMRANKTINAD